MSIYKTVTSYSNMRKLDYLEGDEFNLIRRVLDDSHAENVSMSKTSPGMTKRSYPVFVR